MKTKILMLFMALMITNIGLFAQDKKRTTPEERAKSQTEQLAKKLDLTEEQKAKVLEINLKHAKNTPAPNKDENREKRREEMQKKMQDRDNDIKALLTDDQKTKYDEHQKEMREKMKNRSGRNR